MHLVVRHAGRKLHSTIAGAEAVECQPVFEAEHPVDEQPLEKSWDEALSQFMEAKELPQKRSAGTLATKHASFVLPYWAYFRCGVLLCWLSLLIGGVSSMSTIKCNP